MRSFFVITFILLMNLKTVSAYGDTKFSGITTVCKKIIFEQSVGYQGSTGEREQKELITVYYDPSDSIKKDYTTICGTYSEIQQYTFLNGLKDGPSSYYFRVHGGNCDETIKTTGSYKDDQKDGTWIKEDLMDCSGTEGTWFEWINGSYNRVTRTTYNEGKITAGPVSYDKKYEEKNNKK